MRSRLVAAATIAVAMLSLVRHDAIAAPSGITLGEIDVGRHPAVTLEVKVPGVLPDSELPSSSFEVLENSAKRSAVAKRIAFDDTEVVLLLDTSGSMSGEPMAASQRAASDFIGTLPRGTAVAVIGFGAVPTVALPFSVDPGAQRAAIGALVATGETALYDALVTAAELAPSRPGAHRALVVLSDGGDTVSRTTLDAAVAAVANRVADVSVVELATSESDRPALDRIAGATSGRVLRADDPAALGAAYRSVTDNLTSRYRLAYTAKATGTVDLVVRVRVGDQVLQATSRVSYPAVAAAPTRVQPNTADDHVATTVAPDPGFLRGSAGLFTGSLLVATSLAFIGHVVFAPRLRRVHLDGASSPARRSSVTGLAQRATLFTERRLQRSRRSPAIDARLERAGLDIRAAEAVVLGAAVALVAFVVGGFLAGPFIGAILIVVVALAFHPVLAALAARRERQFAAQLDSLLQMLAGGLRAGYGLNQAIEIASTELEAPAGDELRRFTTEVRLGRDPVESLDELAARVRNDDFGWVAQAIRIHREVGGDLAEVLDRVSETIRDRGRLHRQVRALSAEGRISAYILLGLPFAMALVISVLNPGYLDPLAGSGVGYVLLGMAAVLMTVGALWLRKLVRPVF